jgi:hypothetical protein
VVLPDWVLLRRLDRVEVIGAALTAAARGSSARSISGDLSVPATTVRDWIRRFVARTEEHQSRPSASPAEASFSAPTPPTLSALVTTVSPSSSSPGRLWRAANLASCGQLLA